MAFDKHVETQTEFVFGRGPELPTATFEVVIAGQPIETTPVFGAYWSFAAKRQNVFYRRLRGANNYYDDADPILEEYKFTNSYRASDRVSQYLINRVIWNSDADWSEEDQFFRTMMFKLFNKIETWEAIENEFGPISWSAYKFKDIDDFLTRRMEIGERNYSAAYIMPSAGPRFGQRLKHSNHLKLIEWMMAEQYPQRLSAAKTMTEGYNLLLAAPSIGPFLAYQFVTDINYGPLTEFSEMEFVKAGPGALDGISKCFVSTAGLSPEEIIRYMAASQRDYFERFEIEFNDLWGRELQLIDCQNLFCEISKYSRAAYPEIQGLSGRSRIKQKYKPQGRLPAPFYPPDWGLNTRIKKEFGAN